MSRPTGQNFRDASASQDGASVGTTHRSKPSGYGSERGNFPGVTASFARTSPRCTRRTPRLSKAVSRLSRKPRAAARPSPSKCAARMAVWTEIFAKKIRAPLINLRPIADAQLWEIGDYTTWIKRYDTLRSPDRSEIRAHIERFAATPLISIVMPVYNPSPAHLRAAIESVRAQLYPHWELCVVNDASPAKHVDRILARYAKCDRTHQGPAPRGERRDCRRLERRAGSNDRRFRRAARRRRRARARRALLCRL